MQHLPAHPGAVRAQALLNEAAQARQVRLAQAAARAQAGLHPNPDRLNLFRLALRRLHLA
ncbi:hypothetical protein [Deinococcus depolymerans]